MSNGYDSNNPSDLTGARASQQFVTAVVVSDKDPTQTGRFRCRFIGEQDDKKVSDEQLPWYSCITNGQAQLKGIGESPSGSYLPGSRVILLNLGQQQWAIVGAISNSQEGQGKEDRHPESTKGTPVRVNDGQNAYRKWFKGSIHPSKYPRTTEDALGLLNSTIQAFVPRIGEQQRKEEINNQAKRPKYMGGDARAKHQPNDPGETIGTEIWNKLRNAQKQVQSKANAELIKQAVDMMEKLKKAAQGGNNIRMPNSVGGMGNIIAGLNSINAWYKKHTENQECDCTLDESLLSEECKEECRRRAEMARLQEETNDPNNNRGIIEIV